jgi:hypothetical protein
MSQRIAALSVFVALALGSAVSGEDFAAYVRTSPDFQRVRQDKEILLNRWDHWVLMPWRYQWGRPYDDALAAAMKQAGFNGGFCDHEPGRDSDIHQKYGFLWYLDHTAGKGDLHLKDVSNEQRGRDMRPICLVKPDVRQRLIDKVTRAVTSAKRYGTRAAYALDDEVSWSTFTSPCRWDSHPYTIADFSQWLIQRYGSEQAARQQWGAKAALFGKRMATPDDFLDLYRRPWPEWNLSALCDGWSYMDSQLLNLVGDLVGLANRIDPATPCGFVGGQCPSPYGGYDYAKVARKVQFLEAYDIGCTAEIMRSFNPGNLMPLVQTASPDQRTPRSDWFNWYYFAHGNRGVIVWAEGWFTPGKDMLPAGASVKRLAEASRAIVGGQWVHDGVAIYYSHPSIQVSWFVDCQAHGRTWINRSSSLNNAHASTVAAFWAWTKLLEDARLQYDFVSYADAVTNGIDPAKYKVLVLPRVLALSAQEADVIREYVQRGGRVIADHLPGLFDQHGRGCSSPALGDLFGNAGWPPIGPRSLFGGTLLAETDPETHWKSNFLNAAEGIWPKCQRSHGFVVAQRDQPTFVRRTVGNGSATLLNVSIMEYLRHRAGDAGGAKSFRAPIVELFARAGATPRLSLRVNHAEPARTEAVYWETGDRLFVLVVQNPLRFATETGGQGSADALTFETVPLTIEFALAQKDARDERTGRVLGDGRRFTVEWRKSEAAVLSVKR